MEYKAPNEKVTLRDCKKEILSICQCTLHLQSAQNVSQSNKIQK